MAALWNPHTLLDVDPDEYGFTCVGTTLKGERCRNRVAQPERAKASRVLDQMATRHPREARSSLAYLAEQTLCLNWHRYRKSQIEPVSQRWRRVINRAYPEDSTYLEDSTYPEDNTYLEDSTTVSVVRPVQQAPTLTRSQARRFTGFTIEAAVQPAVASQSAASTRYSSLPTTRVGYSSSSSALPSPPVTPSPRSRRTTPSSSSSVVRTPGSSQTSTPPRSPTAAVAAVSRWTATRFLFGGATAVSARLPTPRSPSPLFGVLARETHTATSSIAATAGSSQVSSPALSSSAPSLQAAMRIVTSPSSTAATAGSSQAPTPPGSPSPSLPPTTRRDTLWSPTATTPTSYQSPTPLRLPSPVTVPTILQTPSRPTTPNPVTPSQSTTAATATTPPSSTRRRPITEPCAVCITDIDHPDDGVWCRAQCGQTIHRTCFAAWMRSSRASDQPVSCVYCRATWKWEWED